MTETWKDNISPGLSMEVLNWLIIAICLFSKIPQVINLKNKRPSEVKGLSSAAMIMEISGYTIMILYNYKNDYGTLTYLEYPIILVQLYFMFFYVLKAKGHLNNKMFPLMAVFYIVAIISFMTDILPKEFLTYIVPICTPLSGFAKVTYILGMIRTENSDAMSWESWFMSVLTNAARWFCVYIDSGDTNLLINYAISAILSGAVLGTAIYYQLRQPPRAMIATRRLEPSVRRLYHVD